MRELLAQIRKDTDRWECHPLLENLADDFQVLAVLRDRHSTETILLSFANDLMDVSVSLHRDTLTGTWAVRGNLIHQFPFYSDNLWPRSFRKHYISTYKASSDFYTWSSTCMEALRQLCPHVFGICWDGSDFSTGEHFTMLSRDLVFGGNCYAKELPLTLSAKLFRSELALAQYFLLMSFSDFYKGMLPRPINGDTVYPLAADCARRLFSAAPWQLFLCRVPDTTGLKERDIERVLQRSEEVKYGPPEAVLPPSRTIFDFYEYIRPNIKQEVEVLLEEGDVARAACILARYAALYPENFYCHYKLAYIHLWLGQPLKAFAEFGRWVDLHIDHGYYGGALNILDEMAELVPGDPRIHLRKADTYYFQRRDVAATEELMKAGRLCLKAGDEHGLERFRRRMVRLWWGALPSIQNMTAQQMLRVDFCKDLGFYRRESQPRPEEKRLFRDDDWDFKTQKFPIHIDDVRVMGELKRIAEDEGGSASPDLRAEATLKLAFLYLKIGFDRKAEALYERLDKRHPSSAPLCLQHIAEIRFKRSDNAGGIAALKVMERLYRRMELPDKARRVAEKLKEIETRLEEWEGMLFKFSDNDECYLGDCHFDFESDPGDSMINCNYTPITPSKNSLTPS